MVPQDDEGYWDYSVCYTGDDPSFQVGGWGVEGPPVCYPCTVITSISNENGKPYSWHPVGEKPWLISSPAITDESGLLATLGRLNKQNKMSFPSQLDRHSLHSLSISWWRWGDACWVWEAHAMVQEETAKMKQWYKYLGHISQDLLISQWFKLFFPSNV